MNNTTKIENNTSNKKYLRWLIVLSLFDGMSCGRIAFEKAWIPIHKYFASEIEKSSIQVSKSNYPDILQLGDVSKVRYYHNCTCWNNSWYHLTWEWWVDYRVWEIWIDILIWGSPCQWFSFIGKQLNFEDHRSKLFFEYVRLLKEVKPEYFLLENVRMKKEYKDIITEHLFGVEPIEINSSLVSAQNRPRLYWVGKRNNDGTYSKVNIEQPIDKWLVLKDILEKEAWIEDMSSERLINWFRNSKSVFRDRFKLSDIDQKAYCLLAKSSWSIKTQNYVLCDKKGDKLILDTTKLENNGKLPENWKYEDIIKKWKCIRRLTIKEIERLQTVPEWYTNAVAKTSRAIMLWNGWTVDVIKHIFESIFIKD